MSAFTSLLDAVNALLRAPASLSLARPALLVVPLLLGFAVWLAARRAARANGRLLGGALALGGAGALALPVGRRVRLRRLGQRVSAAAAVLAALSLAGPRVDGAPEPSSDEGIDIAVLLDVSGSMLAADFKPKGRLHVAKDVLVKHLLNREHDRIGVVAFAGEAYTQAPLTHDKGLLKTVIRGLRTGVIKDGTAIGDAIATGINRLRDSKAKSKVIVLITDGDSNAGHLAPTRAAALAKTFGIEVYPILVGRGGKVPYPNGTDIYGQPVYVQMEWPTDARLLERIAADTGGTFFRATDEKALATSLQDLLEAKDKTLLKDGGIQRAKIPLTPLVLLAAWLLGMLGYALLSGPGRVLDLRGMP